MRLQFVTIGQNLNWMRGRLSLARKKKQRREFMTLALARVMMSLSRLPIQLQSWYLWETFFFLLESSFRVKGGESKHLQRIGAKNLNCILHVSEWGITLALERTHSVLSQWPLTTIRNYECSDDNEFVFEAGRKSPMGEGKYAFLTTNAEDNAIFDQLDRYASLRASRVRSAGGRNRLSSANDEEIAQAYGQLRWSVMLTRSQLNLGGITYNNFVLHIK